MHAKPVTHIHVHRVQEYIKISTQEEEINTAPDQRFLTLQKQLLFNRKVWVAAKHLTLSHLLVKNTAETVAVNGVEKIEVMDGVDVHTITVKDLHTFCLWPHNVRVHNTDPFITPTLAYGAINLAVPAVITAGKVISGFIFGGISLYLANEIYKKSKEANANCADSLPQEQVAAPALFRVPSPGRVVTQADLKSKTGFTDYGIYNSGCQRSLGDHVFYPAAKLLSSNAQHIQKSVDLVKDYIDHSNYRQLFTVGSYVNSIDRQGNAITMKIVGLDEFGQPILGDIESPIISYERVNSIGIPATHKVYASCDDKGGPAFLRFVKIDDGRLISDLIVPYDAQSHSNINSNFEAISSSPEAAANLSEEVKKPEAMDHEEFKKKLYEIIVNTPTIQQLKTKFEARRVGVNKTLNAGELLVGRSQARALSVDNDVIPYEQLTRDEFLESFIPQELKHDVVSFLEQAKLDKYASKIDGRLDQTSVSDVSSITDLKVISVHSIEKLGTLATYGLSSHFIENKMSDAPYIVKEIAKIGLQQILEQACNPIIKEAAPIIAKYLNNSANSLNKFTGVNIASYIPSGLSSKKFNPLKPYSSYTGYNNPILDGMILDFAIEVVKHLPELVEEVASGIKSLYQWSFSGYDKAGVDALIQSTDFQCELTIKGIDKYNSFIKNWIQNTELNAPDIEEQVRNLERDVDYLDEYNGRIIKKIHHYAHSYYNNRAEWKLKLIENLQQKLKDLPRDQYLVQVCRESIQKIRAINKANLIKQQEVTQLIEKIRSERSDYTIEHNSIITEYNAALKKWELNKALEAEKYEAILTRAEANTRKYQAYNQALEDLIKNCAQCSVKDKEEFLKKLATDNKRLEENKSHEISFRKEIDEILQARAHLESLQAKQQSFVQKFDTITRNFENAKESWLAQHPLEADNFEGILQQLQEAASYYQTINNTLKKLAESSNPYALKNRGQFLQELIKSDNKLDQFNKDLACIRSINEDRLALQMIEQSAMAPVQKFIEQKTQAVQLSNNIALELSKIYEKWESAPVEYAKKLYRAMRAREKALQALEEINHKLLQAIKICQNASNKDHVQAPSNIEILVVQEGAIKAHQAYILKQKELLAHLKKKNKDSLRKALAKEKLAAEAKRCGGKPNEPKDPNKKKDKKHAIPPVLPPLSKQKQRDPNSGHSSGAGKNTVTNASAHIPKYTYKHGKYVGAKYHHQNSNGPQTTGVSAKGVKSPAPKNGQAALDNSVEIFNDGYKFRRIGVSEGEYVVLDGTTQQGFHGHVRPFEEIEKMSAWNKAKKDLMAAGLIDKKGNIL